MLESGKLEEQSLTRRTYLVNLKNNLWQDALI